MKILLSFALLLTSVFAFAQKSIPLDQVMEHVGDSVQVKRKVNGIRYLENARNSPTFINVGGAYPNQLLTVVVWDDVRKTLQLDLPDKKLATAMAVVKGKVELYKGKPQIVIRDGEQLEFLMDEK